MDKSILIFDTINTIMYYIFKAYHGGTLKIKLKEMGLVINFFMNIGIFITGFVGTAFGLAVIQWVLVSMGYLETPFTNYSTIDWVLQIGVFTVIPAFGGFTFLVENITE